MNDPRKNPVVHAVVASIFGIFHVGFVVIIFLFCVGFVVLIIFLVGLGVGFVMLVISSLVWSCENPRLSNHTAENV